MANPEHDATRRPQSRFSAGQIDNWSIPFRATDDPPGQPSVPVSEYEDEAWETWEAQRRIAADPVNHPSHYTQHPSGVECIQITEHMSFCLGNAVKYIWRADLKADAIEDLKKAAWYINREIERRQPKQPKP